MPPAPASPAQPDPTENSGQPERPDQPAAPRARASLAAAVREIERHVASGGWDGPVRVFALVGTARAMSASPELADQLTADVLAAASADETHLTSIEQEGLPSAADLEHLLGSITWPEGVDGAAITVERVVLPPAAEVAMPSDPDEALAYLMAHADRQDVRIAVGALRSGESWSAIRTRAHDDDDAVATGPDLVPGLLEALRGTLA